MPCIVDLEARFQIVREPGVMAGFIRFADQNVNIVKGEAQQPEQRVADRSLVGRGESNTRLTH